MIFLNKMYSIWLLPSEKNLFDISNITKNNLSHNANIIPHLTLIPLLNIELDALIQKVEKIIVDLNKFNLRLNGIKHSNDFWKCIYIDIEINNILIDLYKQFEISFKEKLVVKNYIFKPHISLLYGDYSKNEKNSFLSKILSSKFDFNKFLEINKLVIYFIGDLNDSKTWKLVNEFKLK